MIIVQLWRSVSEQRCLMWNDVIRALNAPRMASTSYLLPRSWPIKPFASRMLSTYTAILDERSISLFSLPGNSSFVLHRKFPDVLRLLGASLMAAISLTVIIAIRREECESRRSGICTDFSFPWSRKSLLLLSPVLRAGVCSAYSIWVRAKINKSNCWSLVSPTYVVITVVTVRNNVKRASTTIIYLFRDTLSTFLRTGWFTESASSYALSSRCHFRTKVDQINSTACIRDKHSSIEYLDYSSAINHYSW